MKGSCSGVTKGFRSERVSENVRWAREEGRAAICDCGFLKSIFKSTVATRESFVRNFFG